jgi:hypothetical protein
MTNLFLAYLLFSPLAWYLGALTYTAFPIGIKDISHTAFVGLIFLAAFWGTYWLMMN